MEDAGELLFFPFTYVFVAGIRAPVIFFHRSLLLDMPSPSDNLERIQDSEHNNNLRDKQAMTREALSSSPETDKYGNLPSSSNQTGIPNLEGDSGKSPVWCPAKN